MNFNGVFDEWNYINEKEIINMTVEEIKESVREMALDKSINATAYETIDRLTQSEVESYKSWVYEPQFMDYVVRGMKNFLKSPFKS